MVPLSPRGNRREKCFVWFDPFHDTEYYGVLKRRTPSYTDSLDAAFLKSMIRARPPGLRTRYISSSARTDRLKFLKAARQSRKSNASGRRACSLDRRAGNQRQLPPPWIWCNRA